MQSVLVTGASSGFGVEITLDCAKRGWDVFASMRNLDRGEALARAARDRGLSARVHAIQLDVTDAGSIQDGVGTALRLAGGRLDAVVHNAGIGLGGAFEDITDEDVRRIMDTNFFGVLAVTRVLLPSFRKARHGRIVIVSSESACAGQPAMSAYAASKWAVEGWAESVAYEIAPFGIDIVVMQPGVYRTPIWDKSPRVWPRGSPYEALIERIDRAAAKLVEKGGDPRDVGAAVGRVLEARRPAFRYPLGPDARLLHWMHGKVPAGMQRRLLARMLGIAGVRL